MSTTTIRPLTLTDLPTLQAISRETFTATFGPSNTAENLAKYLDTAYATPKLTRELTNPNSRFFFIQTGTTVCGYLKVNIGNAQTEPVNPAALEVERIYIRPAYQKLGLGKQLLAYAEQLARAAHQPQMWLGVWEHNDNARAFYAKHGFNRVGEHTFTMGGSHQTDFLLAKDL